MKNNKGFTLIELMVVVILFTIGILALAQTRMFTNKALQQTANVGNANIIARQYLEDAQSADFTSVVSGTYTHGQHNEYTVNRVVTQNPYGWSNNLKLVEVTVSWKTANLPADNITISTLISRRLGS